METLRVRQARSLRRLALAVAVVLAATDGVLGQAESSSGFQGFYIPNPTSTEALMCGGGDQFITSGTQANCCVTGQTKPCTIPTSCLQGTIFYDQPGSTFVCGSQYSCVTMTIYAASPAVLPSAKNIFCGQNWVANTVYRTTQAITTSTSTSSTSSIPTSVASTIPISTSSTTPEPVNGGSSTSNAWIAGAVIGPIVVVVAVGLFAFWIGSKRRLTKQKALAAQQAGAGGPGYSAVPMVGVHGSSGPGSPQPYVAGDGSQYDPSKYGGASPPAFANSVSPQQGGVQGGGGYYGEQGQWIPGPQQGWQQHQQGGQAYGFPPQQQHAPPLPPQELPGDARGDVELPGSSPAHR